MTRLGTGRNGAQFLAGVWDLSILWTVQLGPGPQPETYRGLFSGGGDVSYDHSQDLVSRLRRNGVINQLPLYDFVECIWAIWKYVSCIKVKWFATGFNNIRWQLAVSYAGYFIVRTISIQWRWTRGVQQKEPFQIATHLIMYEELIVLICHINCN